MSVNRQEVAVRRVIEQASLEEPAKPNQQLAEESWQSQVECKHSSMIHVDLCWSMLIYVDPFNSDLPFPFDPLRHGSKLGPRGEVWRSCDDPTFPWATAGLLGTTKGIPSPHGTPCQILNILIWLIWVPRYCAQSCRDLSTCCTYV